MAIINDWITGKVYREDEVVVVKGESAEFNDRIYRCLTQHTSFSWATDYGNSYWESIRTQGITGPQGNAGVAGPAGADGADGSQGPAGADGADGLITAIANQSEAENGVENSKAMTALRTKQAIDFQLTADRAQIATNTSDLTFAGGLPALDTRMTTIENAIQIERAVGKQKMLNNQLVPIDIEGGDIDPDGQGNTLQMSTAGAKSARVHTEIYRKDDGEVRFTTCILLLHFIPGINQWRMERESTTAIVGNPDGVTFDITTTEPASGVFVGQVNYISDDMAGGNYDVESYVKYYIYEISDTF